MTDPTRKIRLPITALGLVGALALGGCAAGTVGDDWQCPLAQGQVCTSVAAADPAVADSAKPEDLPVRAPARQMRAAGPGEPAPGCGWDCDVLAWLGRAFGAAPDDAGTPTAADQAAADPEVSAPGTGAPAAADIDQGSDPGEEGIEVVVDVPGRSPGPVAGRGPAAPAERQADAGDGLAAEAERGVRVGRVRRAGRGGDGDRPDGDREEETTSSPSC